MHPNPPCATIQAMSTPPFRLQAVDGEARAGTLRTPHGELPTPAFMPVATQGAVKALDPSDLRAIGARVVLSNAYHLSLRPGADAVRRLGGLHAFMGWPGPMLTDSGGFQGFSLKHLRTITDDGIVFRSHVDGTINHFTPEAAVLCQQELGADMIMPLDVCAPAEAERGEVETAVERTARWAVRCREAHPDDGEQLLFGIVQGGLFEDLRLRSAEHLVALDFPGYAVGGLSVGESKREMYRTLSLTTRMLPADRPRYLMGVGSPEDLVEGVARGIDMFDCVLPTRIARNGALLVSTGRANVYTSRFRALDGPVEDGCDCYTCTTFSAAYLHHLFKAKELLAYRLTTLHNLRFVLRLMEDMRAAVSDGRFESFRAEFLGRFVPPDERTRSEQKAKWEAARLRRG